MSTPLFAAGSRSAWAGALLLLAACGAPEAPAPAAAPRTAQQAIINGHTDSADVGAAMLLVVGSDGSGYLCSGAIIGPHTFLTAAHCTEGLAHGGTAGVSNATNALQAFQSGQYWQVDNLTPYSGYRPNAGALDWHDIGLAHVVQTMPPPYLPVNRYPLERMVILGQPVREVGYGITQGSADGGQGEGTRRDVVKRDTTTRGTGELESGAATGLTCSGDSGGPALFVTPDGLTTVIGVTSRGDEDCSRNGIDTRPDPYLQWISDYMTQYGDAPSCGADGRCGFNCTAPDPDCPCAPDGFCTSACADPSADPDCPQSCLYDGGSCIPPAPPPPPPKAPATAIDSGCQSVDGVGLLPLALAVTLLSRRRRKRCPGRPAAPHC